jgi:hypothetical protein
MKKWHVTTDVLEARGSQVWAIYAETAEEAIRLVDKGEGDIIAEEIEVMHCGKPYGAEEVKEA